MRKNGEKIVSLWFILEDLKQEKHPRCITVHSKMPFNVLLNIKNIRRQRSSYAIKYLMQNSIQAKVAVDM
jgi:hypothetical protein